MKYALSKFHPGSIPGQGRFLSSSLPTNFLSISPPQTPFIHSVLLGTEFSEGLRTICTWRVVKSIEAMSLAATESLLYFSKQMAVQICGWQNPCISELGMGGRCKLQSCSAFFLLGTVTFEGQRMLWPPIIFQLSHCPCSYWKPLLDSGCFPSFQDCFDLETFHLLSMGEDGRLREVISGMVYVMFKVTIFILRANSK